MKSLAPFLTLRETFFILVVKMKCAVLIQNNSGPIVHSFTHSPNKQNILVGDADLFGFVSVMASVIKMCQIKTRGATRCGHLL